MSGRTGMIDFCSIAMATMIIRVRNRTRSKHSPRKVERLSCTCEVADRNVEMKPHRRSVGTKQTSKRMFHQNVSGLHQGLGTCLSAGRRGPWGVRDNLDLGIRCGC